ncbi:lysostaphin resistance A-like protein [Candidatus Zixiibacteriota bacterium]
MARNGRAILIMILLAVGCRPAHAQRSTLPIDSNRVPLIYLMAPGGTYFHEGNYAAGVAFALAELSFLAAGLLINDRLETDERTELNVPLLSLQQAYIIDKWGYYQKNQLRLRRQNPGMPGLVEVDRTPFGALLCSPFKPKIFTRPFVLGFTALGIANGILIYHFSDRHYTDISAVRAVGGRMDRTAGTLYHESLALGVSYGAAVSEEMLFRGFLLPFLDHELGKTKGLIGSSVTFGALHLLNPDMEQPLFTFTYITAAGLAFGYNVQRNDYRLGEAIAAHFWYDLAILTALWVADPENNGLGLGVEFKY